MVTKIEVPPAFGDFGKPFRYRIFYGGRGSSKSWSVARVLIAMAAARPLRILCLREFQNSINDSVKRLLEDQIQALGLMPWFDVQGNIIRSQAGALFIFKGLARNIHAIKSLEGTDLCWIEEGQSIKQDSLDILIPTIRKAESEIWITYNPHREDDPVHRLMLRLRRDPAAYVRKIGWQDNPWLPEELDKERRRLLEYDPESYDHVWEGECRKTTNATIFKDRVTNIAFDTPEHVQFYYGADWGFAQDPTVLIRCFTVDENLYIDYEAFGFHVEMDQLPRLFSQVPEADKWPILADNSRPETISYLSKKFGFKIFPAQKWPGSIEDGIARLRSFHTIFVHERCPNIAKEFRQYAFKTDPRSNLVLPTIDDQWNHGIDALRYALTPLIRNKRQLPSFKSYSRRGGP